MRFDVLTLFPGLLAGFVGESLVRRAIDAGLIEIHAWDFRQWTADRHQKVDDRPFGGGPGMVIAPQPVVDCIEAVRHKDARPARTIVLSAAGRQWTQADAVEHAAAGGRLILLCGRYEGFDQRIVAATGAEEVSVGEFVTNGGEIPAMLLMETVVRLRPGVMGDQGSADEESHSRPGWVEYPQYTRPVDFRGLTVPEVLRSGDHGRIAAWRAEQARRRSRNGPAGGPSGPAD